MLTVREADYLGILLSAAGWMVATACASARMRKLPTLRISNWSTCWHQVVSAAQRTASTRTCAGISAKAAATRDRRAPRACDAKLSTKL